MLIACLSGVRTWFGWFRLRVASPPASSLRLIERKAFAVVVYGRGERRTAFAHLSMRIDRISSALRALRGEKSFAGRRLPEPDVAIARLRMHTGQDFGRDAAAWDAWLRANPWAYRARAGDPRYPRSRKILAAAEVLGRTSIDGFVKCDQVIRSALENSAAWDELMELAVCNGGFEQPDVAYAYNTIRGLVDRGLLEGRGDLAKPAGPRYTECRISSDGRRLLETPD